MLDIEFAVQIDWNNVAGQLDITNGHAARMRFSRFKQQMEGIPPAPRKPRSAVPRNKKPKLQKPPKPEPRDDASLLVKAKTEPMHGIESTIKPEPFIKEEPDQRYGGPSLEPNVDVYPGDMQQPSSEAHPLFQHEDHHETESLNYPWSPPPIIKPEPVVKMESSWDN